MPGHHLPSFGRRTRLALQFIHTRALATKGVWHWFYSWGATKGMKHWFYPWEATKEGYVALSLPLGSHQGHVVLVLPLGSHRAARAGGIRVLLRWW